MRNTMIVPLLVDKFRMAMDGMAKWGAVLLLLGAPTSIVLTNVATLLVVVGWILSANYSEKLEIIKANPIALPSVSLFLLVLIGSIYSEAPQVYIDRHYYVYSRLILMLMLLTLFYEEQWRKKGLWAFALGSLVTLASTYANIWLHVPWSDTQNQGFGVSHHVFNDHIAQGLAMSVFISLCIVYAVESARTIFRYVWIGIGLLGVFSVTHLIMSRTGQIVLVAALVGMIFVSVAPRWRWLSFAGVTGTMAIIFTSSPLLRERFAVATEEVSRYLSGDMTLTSNGARLDMWINSINMIIASPWWGHGTAGYRFLAEKIYLDPAYCKIACIHPHNQFLFFWVDHGLLGFLAYCFLLYVIAWLALLQRGGMRLMLTAIFIIILIDSFINGPFWVSTERNLFTAIVPLLMASWTSLNRVPQSKSYAAQLRGS